MKRSKKYVEALNIIDKTKTYNAKEAMETVVNTSKKIIGLTDLNTLFTGTPEKAIMSASNTKMTPKPKKL